MRRAVIFDLDGTLLDTLADLADSMNYVLLERGFPEHPEDSYRYFVGDGITNLVKRALPEDRRGNGTFVTECVTEMKQAYRERWNAKTRPYAGINELLMGLEQQGVALSVLSNKPHEFTVEVMDHYFPGFAFQAVYGARPDVPVKPDPAGVADVLTDLGLTTGDVLYVGDTSTDMRTAVNAGLDAVGVTWGFRPRKELEEHGAWRCIDQPLELMNLL